MSDWIDVNDIRDLSLSDDGKEIHIYLKANYQGNVYASIPIKVMRQFLKSTSSSVENAKKEEK